MMHEMTRLFFTLVLALSFTVLAQDPVPQDVTTQDTQTQETQAQDAGSQTTGSLEFSQALGLSQQSPSVVLAQGQRDLAQKQLEVSRGAFSGQFTTGYTQTFGEARSTLPTGEEQKTSLNDGSFDSFALSGTFNVVPYGPNADTIQKALWGLEQAELSLRDAQATAVINTAQSYLTALRAGQELALKQFSVEVATQQLEANRVRAEAGAATEQQVLQAEIALSQAQNDLSTAQRSNVQALASLSNQLGVAVASVSGEAPTAALPENLDLAENLDLEKQLLLRSDVKNALIAVQQAELNAASTTRQYLPSGSLNLTFAASEDKRQFAASAGYDTKTFQPNASLSFDPSSERGVEGSSSNSFSINLGATVPLETSLEPALEAARLSIEQSQMQAQQTQELARLEIDNSQRQLDAAKTGLEFSQQLVDQSQQTYDTTKERFELGLIIKLDVLTADEALREAQLNLSKAQDSYLAALLQYLTTLAVNPMEVF
jgi:outer membrane protein TolC